jgi:hypothetical protein
MATLLPKAINESQTTCCVSITTVPPKSGPLLLHPLSVLTARAGNVVLAGEAPGIFPHQPLYMKKTVSSTMPGRIVAYHRRDLLLNILELPIMAVAFLRYKGR